MTDRQQHRRRPGRVPVAVGIAVVAVLALLVVIGAAVLRDDDPPVVPLLPDTPTSGAPTSGAPASAVPSGVPADGRRASAVLFRDRAPGAWPGPTGLSGVNGDPLFDTARVQAFCAARGRPCGVAQTYTDRTTYQSMTGGTAWTFDNLADFPGMLVVSQGLVPEGRPQDLAPCAGGAFDQHWRTFGALMVQHGRGDSVVRLGWEFNGDFMAWRATDPQTWIACYRRAADGIRATNPAVVLDWTINAHDTPAGICGGVSTTCYPGDDYVDIVGIDNYDHFPAAVTEADFDRLAAAPEGLDWLYAFARQHGKPFAVGEWGVVQNGNGGGDNAGFVRWMHAWFAAHAKDLAYEAYFTNCEPGGVQSSLFRTDPGCLRNPTAADTYRRLFAG